MLTWKQEQKLKQLERDLSLSDDSEEQRRKLAKAEGARIRRMKMLDPDAAYRPERVDYALVSQETAVAAEPETRTPFKTAKRGPMEKLSLQRALDDESGARGVTGNE